MARTSTSVDPFAISDRMNQLVLEQLDRRAWRAPVPGERGRTIAAIVAHMHNVRCKWIRLTAPHLGVPALLDRARCTQAQARTALARSAARCVAMLHDPAVTSFSRDGWSGRLPAGSTMLAYMLTHDAHHRGQVCMLAHQVGCRLPTVVDAGIWAWERIGR